MDFHSSTQPVLKIIKPFRQLKEILAFSTPLTCNRLLVNLLHSIESILIPGHLCLFGMTQQPALSVYVVLNGMALPLILFPCAITNAVSVMLLPSVAEHQALGNYDNIRLCIQKTICYCLILGFLFTFGFFFLADFLGLFLFKNDFYPHLIIYLSLSLSFKYLKWNFKWTWSDRSLLFSKYDRSFYPAFICFFRNSDPRNHRLPLGTAFK